MNILGYDSPVTPGLFVAEANYLPNELYYRTTAISTMYYVFFKNLLLNKLLESTSFILLYTIYIYIVPIPMYGGIICMDNINY